MVGWEFFFFFYFCKQVLNRQETNILVLWWMTETTFKASSSVRATVYLKEIICVFTIHKTTHHHVRMSQAIIQTFLIDTEHVEININCVTIFIANVNNHWNDGTILGYPCSDLLQDKNMTCLVECMWWGQCYLLEINGKLLLLKGVPQALHWTKEERGLAYLVLLLHCTCTLIMLCKDCM